MSADPLWAIVPVKRFAEAKLRLAGMLSDRHRSGLAEAMLRDVLAAAAGCAEIAGIVVVTCDESAAGIAGGLGAEVLQTASDPGHNQAIRAGVSHLRGRASTLLVLSADIPLMRAEDISGLVSLHAPSPAVTIARAAADNGTNALVLSPPDIIDFSFGKASAPAHLKAARQAGAAARSLIIPRMAFDLDRPEDVTRFLRAPSSTFAYRLLRGIAEAGELSPQPAPQGEFS
jgi:2-phospho-L-lactate guanylyltransferase